MDSRQGDIPAIEPAALESEVSMGLFGALSCPIGMTRRTFSYDEALDSPMHSPPSDMSANILWKDPVIPKRFNIAEERGSGNPRVQSSQLEVPAATKPAVPVVKAKACSLMNSLMIKQSQESMQRFEHQAGLTDAGYTPHKGLSAEDTHFHRLAEKLRMPSGDHKEERLTSSAQSTPSITPCGTPSVTPSATPSASPHASPSLSRRSWYSLSPAPFPACPELCSANPAADMGGNEGGGGGGVGGERWSFFGTRPVVQKSSTDPGSETNPGFTLQSYFGLHKSTTMDSIKSQVDLKVEDPANFNPPKIEITGIEANRPLPRPHKLKPRDMNVLTPSGF